MTKKTLFARYLSDDCGATAIEYGIIAALISVVIIGGATLVSGSVNGLFTDTNSELTTAFEP